MESQVLIVGGGPVGLTLALDLAYRGIASTVIERRPAGERPSVKCNHVSSRTMETFRRLGFAQEVRAAGLPDDFPNDVVFRTSFCGLEMGRIPIPGRASRFTDKSGPDGWWPTPEPPHRVNQVYLEPILFHRAKSNAMIEILNEWEVTQSGQTGEHAFAVIRDLRTGEERRLSALYLVGCDGGASGVRKSIGAKLHGDAVIQRVQSTHIRAPDLLGRVKGRPAWFNYSYNSDRPGSVIAIDGIEEWLVHCYLLPHEETFDSVDRDRQIRHILGVGPDFPYDMVAKEDWIGRRLVADHFRDRRIFIDGDAAHLWVPYAGYGMNAGIADAVGLSWLLAAHLNGWAPASILDGYVAERQPITDQVSRFAMSHAAKAIKERNSIPSNVEDDTPEAAALRAEIGRKACDLNVQQYACAGLNYGYYYDESPLIVADSEAPPAYSMYDYTPSTVPGCRLPHFWLADGRSLYDALGPEFTLLRIDRHVAVAGFVDAAHALGCPLAVLDIDQSDVPDAYRYSLLIVRPDRHVAWRGAAEPEDAASVLARLTGRMI